MTRYDRTGRTYSQTRQPDPRIAVAIDRELRGIASVANIGAGTGSYEPAATVVAVEPSRVMINQRRSNAVPVIRAVAERLPIRSNAVDAAIALLTIHHWSDAAAGVAEMIRIARRRVLIFTWDDTVFRQFWLLREYLPAAAETDARMAIPISLLTSLFDELSILPIPIAHDCVDGFGGAYWRRPHAYLDETVQAGMSMLALTPKNQLRDGLTRLRDDLATGEWSSQHADIIGKTHLDLGYRLVVAELPSGDHDYAPDTRCGQRRHGKIT
jgi:SAM-dependent methyltransferase